MSAVDGWEDIVDVAKPIVEEGLLVALIEEREAVLEALVKFLDRDPSREEIRLYVESNLALLEYVKDGYRP